MCNCVPYRRSLVKISANNLVGRGGKGELRIRLEKGRGGERERKVGKEPVLPVKNISPASLLQMTLQMVKVGK